MAEQEKNQILYIVIPCFNEEAVLPDTAKRLETVMTVMIQDGLISRESRLLFVDDGSDDNTWEKIKQCAGKSPLIEGIALRKNVGHQKALYAGLMEVKPYCQMTVSLDADLQDDPDLIPSMVEKFYQGNDIVYAVRRRRRGESAGKKISAFLFYRFMKILGADMPKDCGDFRLLSRRALEELSLFQENRLFLRGMIPLLGLPSAFLYFERNPRSAGKSKYSLIKMIFFAMDGIFSLSTAPIYLLLILGILLFFGAGLWIIFNLGNPQQWRMVTASIWAAAGLLLTGMGILGQYILQIWQNQLNRPCYQVREWTKKEEKIREK